MRTKQLLIGQIALEAMLHSSYDKKINLENFEIEMRQAFMMYPKNIVLDIADSKVFAEKKSKIF